MSKLSKLSSAIAGKKRLAVMLSGGLDSSVLASFASRTLSDNAVAITIDSPVSPSHERECAARTARETGIRLLTIKLNELEDTYFSSNPPDRCYICRKIRHRAAKKTLGNLGFDVIADGVNIEDLSDYRPGLKASEEDGIWHPLAEAGLTKSELREVARSIGLSAWDKNPSPCLCTRFAYGMHITVDDLLRVDAAETFLKNFCRGNIRLRCFPTGVAMIETNDFESVLNNRKAIADTLRKSGFVFCGLDIEGFTSGKMNRLLGDAGNPERRRTDEMAKCAKTAAKAAKPAAKKTGCAKTSKCGAKKKA